MLKKLFILFFAFTVFMPCPSFAAAGAKIFAQSALSNNSAKVVNDIQNDVRFARDYSRIVSDVCKNFVNDIVSFMASLDCGRSQSGFQKYAKRQTFAEGIIVPKFSEKTVYASVSFTGIEDIKASHSPNAVFLFLLLAFILWYIGLLRLFSADFSFAKQIKV